MDQAGIHCLHIPSEDYHVLCTAYMPCSYIYLGTNKENSVLGSEEKVSILSSEEHSFWQDLC